VGKKSRRKRRFRDANYSDIPTHKVVGKRLVPPLNTVPNYNPSSWSHDHAPEMLWALLVASAFRREEYLDCFRAIASWLRHAFPPPPDDDGPSAQTKHSAQQNSDAEFDCSCEIDHTSLAELSDKHFQEFVDIIVKHPLGYAALRPLLLLDSVPGIDRWRRVLGVEPTNDDWHTLGVAVVSSLDHQSEKSTDVRWLKYVLKAILRKIVFHEALRETAAEIIAYPNKGDLRKVRPSIRAGEMMLRRSPPSDWIKKYWAELESKTECIDNSAETDYFATAVPTLTRDAILSARHELAQSFLTVMSSTRTDAKLDAAFGFVLYAFSLLEEVAAPPLSQFIVGRLGLRSIAEVVITFSYLVKKNDAELWTAYRNFGSGQAKLAFLKAEQESGDTPSFVDQETLFQIANEDVWQEFLNIDLGHWANKNLRALAIEGGTKDVYDRYYDWTSTFAHAHWCAIRDSNFVTCHNPLHRLHRIPRPYHRLMPTVVRDAVELVNKCYDLLERTYPNMEKVGRIVEEPPKEKSGTAGAHEN
jgi:hypothetical protein